MGPFAFFRPREFWLLLSVILWKLSTEKFFVCALKFNPPAVINLVYADYFGLNKEFTAILVMTVTVFALLTLPLLLYLGSLLVPQ